MKEKRWDFSEYGTAEDVLQDVGILHHNFPFFSLFLFLSLPLPKSCIIKWCRLCEIEKVQRMFLNAHSRVIQVRNLFCIAHKHIWNRNYIRFFRLYLVLFMRSILYKIGCPVCELPWSWVLNTQVVALFYLNTKICVLN